MPEDHLEDHPLQFSHAVFLPSLYNNVAGYTCFRSSSVPFPSSNAFLRIAAARPAVLHRHDSAVTLSVLPCTAR